MPEIPINIPAGGAAITEARAGGRSLTLYSNVGLTTAITLPYALSASAPTTVYVGPVGTYDVSVRATTGGALLETVSGTAMTVTDLVFTPAGSGTGVGGVSSVDGQTGSVVLSATYAPLATQPLGARGLSSRAPYERPAVSAAPTLTLSSSQPGSTPTGWLGSTGGAGGDLFTSVNTAAFTFIGGKYIKASPGFPRNLACRIMPNPQGTSGFGPAIAEFFSDAPALSTQMLLNQNGSQRILVDGVEVYRCTPAIRTSTAQAGASGSITLDTGSSATNGFYLGRFVRITGGTGAGQVRLISGYTGSTKVATVSPNWSTAPDATSTFAVELYRQDNNNSSGNGWVLLDWSGERRFRHYRIEHDGSDFVQVNTAAIDTVMPADPRFDDVTVWVGDSFGGGTYSSGAYTGSLAAIACGLLGWSLVNASIGGTGYLNPPALTSSVTLNARDRMIPPTNSWYVRLDGSTAGTFTVTQNGVTTAAVAYNASLATLRTAISNAFGASAFDVCGQDVGNFWLISRSAPTSTAPLTVDMSGITGGSQYFARWTGLVDPNVPRDSSGAALPFNLVLNLGHNDTISTNAAFTPTAVQAEVTTLLTQAKAKWPTARIFVIGNMYLPGSPVGSDVTNANAAILAACQAVLPKLNGTLPFIDTVTTPWFSGTGRVGALSGTGNSDLCTDTDNVHPTPWGHIAYGRRLAQAFTQILGRNVNP